MTASKILRSFPKRTSPGVCQLPEGAKLYTGQRFDGYEGVSCMIHSEGNKAQCAGCGCDYKLNISSAKIVIVELETFGMGNVRRVAS